MNKLKIIRRQNKNVTILDLSGKVQLGESSILFRITLRELAKNGEKSILLNLAEVSQIDSSGLGEFVSGAAALRKIGGEIKLLNLPQRINEIMTITKLLTVFETFENEESAVNSFQKDDENAEDRLADTARAGRP